MKPIKFVFLMSIVIGAAIPQWAFCDSEMVYVQPVKTDLKAEPKMSAPTVVSLKRGDPLTIVKKEGLWFQVSYSTKNGKQGGWVSKLFVNPNRPIGEAELAKELSEDQNLGKAARRRSSSYATSASTRGLTAGNRVREGREMYSIDSESVNKMESLKVDQKEFQKFQDDGNLSM